MEILENFREICLAFIVIILLTFLFKYFTKYGKTGNKYGVPFAPGPAPRFLVGNMHDIPRSNAAICYIEWGKRYNSNILHFSALGNHFIVLNSLEDAEELLEKRSTIYSDRPVIPIIQMVGWDCLMSLMPMNNVWREHRRLAQKFFRQDTIAQYYPIQLSKVRKFLQGLLDNPERFNDHNKMLSMSVPMSILYGHNLESPNDPLIVASEKSNQIAIKLLQPGYTLIGILPFLQHIPSWIPGAVSQRMAKESKKMTEILKLNPLETVKKQMEEGTAPPSLVSKYISGEYGEQRDENMIADLAFTVYSAGSDTMVSATSSLFYLLATHPEVQVKAQKELDSAIGTDRLPSFEDRPTLPYIEAIYREILRWRPPGRLNLVHKVTEDDIYRGYFIPKGSMVIANIWAMCQDGNKYQNPHEFNPERFLDADGRLNKDERILAYGFGRRICVGQHLASTSLWLTITSILAAFTFSKARDEEGNEIEIDDEFLDSGLVTHKAPFKCRIMPRSETARRLIQEADI